MLENVDGMAHSLIRQWIETEQVPHLITDRNLRIKWNNNVFAESFFPCSILENRDGCLYARALQHQAMLHSFVGSLGVQTAVLSLPGEEGKGGLFLRGRVINPFEANDRLGLRVFRQEDNAFGRLSEDLTALYGLTRAECVVLTALMRGNNAEQSAFRIGVSIETVRTHIRRIYKKLNVKSREELYAKLYPHLLMA